MDESVTTISALLQEFGTRLNELEEKQRLLKDRLLLIGNNLIYTKEDFEKKDLEFRKKIGELNSELNSIKQLNKRMIYELENFARKEEFSILERQFKIFQPLEFVRINDLKKILSQEFNKLKNEKI
ncbi:hypothetical protein J4218_00385 [Candidatus Pacearchaeota archaeon]|nr:hypothetical protein [Candidatus Pacearchaeota archaeon]